MPERHFDTEQLLADVDRVYSKHGLCTIAVSEGISDKEGTPMIVKLLGKEERDSHGNVQLSGTGALGGSSVPEFGRWPGGLAFEAVGLLVGLWVWRRYGLGEPSRREALLRDGRLTGVRA